VLAHKLMIHVPTVIVHALRKKNVRIWSFMLKIQDIRGFKFFVKIICWRSGTDVVHLSWISMTRIWSSCQTLKMITWIISYASFILKIRQRLGD
jgi:hypothetical protein